MAIPVAVTSIGNYLREQDLLVATSSEHPLQLAVAGKRSVVDEAWGEIAEVVGLPLVVLASVPASARLRHCANS